MRRLLSLRALSGMAGGVVFTRDKDASTEAERAALLHRVREATQKPPEGK